MTFKPATRDLPVSRNAPFPTAQFAISLNLTGQRLMLQVRNHEGEPGSPLINVTSAASGGIVIDHIDTAKPETVFHFEIAKATMEGLPAPDLPDQVLRLPFDLKAGPNGAEEVVWAAHWIVRTGVTR